MLEWYDSTIALTTIQWKPGLKKKQGRTLVSYSKWKCPGIKSCLGLDLGLPLERTPAPLLFSREGKYE